MKHYRFESGDNMEQSVNYFDDSFNNEVYLGSPNLLNLEESTDILGDNLDFKLPLSVEQPVMPPSQYGPPARGDFAGPYNFETSLSADATHHKKYVYSVRLNRAYKKINTEMPVQFQWNWNASRERRLWVRATPVFARDEDQEHRVLRCVMHKEANELSNRDLINKSIIPHVLRSARQGPDIFYSDSETNDKFWFSVAFEAPCQPSNGATALQHVYKMCCSHSCLPGINRRPLEILFTLEDDVGTILGRRSLGIRVCSCPKRDMEKDESEYRALNHEQPPTKKRRIMPNNNTDDSTSSYVINGLYNNGIVAIRQLPADNPAIPLIQQLNTELLRQINNEK